MICGLLVIAVGAGWVAAGLTGMVPFPHIPMAEDVSMVATIFSAGVSGICLTTIVLMLLSP